MNQAPPYRVPSMEEIRALRGTSGFRVVSTFSGCGGSCTGFEWAGFMPLWANEFIAAARETYAANHPGVIVDGRDIREVDPAAILSEVGLAEGELDAFEGSPPCSPFSSAGRGSKGWGQEVAYSDRRQRVDDLFDEYVRLVAGLRPRVFVAENVAGLVRGKAVGYFRHVFRALSALGYRVEARVLDAQWLGVPQVRRRLIFVGVREDLGVSPRFPDPLPYRYSLAEAIAGLEASPVEPESSMETYAVGREWKRLRPGQQSERFFSLFRPRLDRPVPTLTTKNENHVASVAHPTECRKFSLAEMRRLCGFPDDFVLSGTFEQGSERLGRAVPPPMMYRVALVLRSILEEAASGRERSS